MKLLNLHYPVSKARHDFKFHKQPLLFLLLFCCLSMISLPCFSAAITIYAAPDSVGDGSSSSTPTSLQNALDSARNQASQVNIWLSQGTYDASVSSFYYALTTGEIENVYIRGDGLDPSLTILDGGGVNQILQLRAHANDARLSVIIKNVTFQNGLASDDSDPLTLDHGGAISAWSGNADSSGVLTLEIENCVFHNNKTSGSINGGAIYSNDQTDIEDCVFTQNEAYDGGAIYALDRPGGNQSLQFNIKECNFAENKNYGNQGSTIWHNLTLRVQESEFHGMSDGSLVGPGSCIWGDPGSATWLYHSLFKNIKVKYWGSALQTFAGVAYVQNCLFINNKAGEASPDGGDGYGTLAFYHDNQPSKAKRINSCTFVGNRSRYPDTSEGGAIHNRGVMSELFTVTNCIFWDNGPNSLYSIPGGTDLKYSDVGGTYSGFSDVEGNLFDVDPLFADTMYRLSAESPCINAGTKTYTPKIYADLDGNLRILSDTIDMGVYEFNTAPDSIYMHDTTILENLGTNQTAATLSGHDPDMEHIGSLQFTLVDGNGTNDIHNSWFDCQGSNFVVKENDSIDYETDSTLYVYLRAADAGGLYTEKAFVLRVQNTNDPVKVTGTIGAQYVTAGDTFSYTFPEDMFDDQDGREFLTYTASLDDNNPLPDWLSFHDSTRTLSGTPQNTDAGTFFVKITATDEGGLSASFSFRMQVLKNTGVDDQVNLDFSLYPNPAYGTVLVSFPESEIKPELELFDLTGKKILMVRDIELSPYTLELGNLDSGIYLVKLRGSKVYLNRLVVR